MAAPRGGAAGPPSRLAHLRARNRARSGWPARSTVHRTSRPGRCPAGGSVPSPQGSRRRSTVLAGSGQSVDRWLGVARPAAAAVQRALPAGVADWAGEVVLEVPATPADFAAVLGQPADRYAGIAAVAYQVGDGDRPPLRVVVNPRSATLVTDDQLTEIVRHELVHVATRSPESPAPLWAVEGLAEWVALRGRAGRRQLWNGRPAGGGPPGRAARRPARRRGLRRRSGRAEPGVRRGLAGLPLRRRDLLGRRPRPALRRA